MLWMMSKLMSDRFNRIQWPFPWIGNSDGEVGGRLEGGISIQDLELLFSFIVQFLQLSSSTPSSTISSSASSLYLSEAFVSQISAFALRTINQMALPAEVTVYKGSKSGKVIKEVVKGRTSLLPNEVAIQMTYRGVSLSNSLVRPSY